MKKLTLIVAGVLFAGVLFSQTTAIPDANFEQALISLGIDTDGIINQSVATADISVVTVLDIHFKSITDLTGIEGFTSLTDLNCAQNQLTKLDLSKNTALKFLNWSYSYVLTSLDLSQNINLESLNVSNTSLTSLDLSQNIKLESIDAFNSKLTSLDVSKNTTLIILRCALNKLTSLDVSKNTALTILDIRFNQLTSLDVSQNTVLSSLMCNNNLFSSVNVRNGNNSNMSYLDFTNLPSLSCIQVDNEADANMGLRPYNTWEKDATASYMEDCSRVTYVPDDNFEQALIDLGFDNDGIINDNVETAGIFGVTDLNIENKNITDLTGIEDFAFLEILNCQNNQLSNIDCSANTFLEELNCSANQLNNLDVSQNSALIKLNCGNNSLSNLNLNTVLTELNCSTNQLNDLDVSQNTALIKLDCSYNLIAQLNLNKNSALTDINCSNNQLTMLDVYNSNNSLITTFNANNNPDLLCISVYNEADANSGLAPYNSWQKDDATIYSEGCLDSGFTYIPDNNFEQALIDLLIDTDQIINNSVATADISGITALDVSGKLIYSLNGIEDFTSLTNLNCKSNPLTSLNLSQNTALTVLDISYNSFLTSIDLTQNTALIWLKMDHCNMVSVDLSQNTALENLYCFFGQLTSLDLSKNPSLKLLNCYFNQLTSLNIKNGNNAILSVTATANYDLQCIQVDNETDANNGVFPYTNWGIDPSASYSEDCSFSGLTFIPDDNFEQALIDLGIDKDGTVNDSVAIADIYQIISLNIASKNITDLTGIEDFKSLEILYCQSNQIGNLDLSENTSLTELNCSANLLTGLNVNNNNNNALLTTFNATGNPYLQCIKVDNEINASNGLLPYIFWQIDDTANYSEACLEPGYTYIPDNNFEQELIDLSIDTDGIINKSVATADILGLTSLNVAAKGITNLKGIEDFISLTTLECQSNTIASLDLSQNTALEYLDCHSNKITSLNISQNTALTELDCRSNLLTSLNVSNNVLLFKLTCSQNKLTSLNVSNNIGLIGLFCYSNLLTSLDVSKNVLLEGLYCDQNQISFLNLNGASALQLLFCGTNQLTSLDVSQNIALIRLDCYFNQLPILDISQNKALNNLDCSRNQLLYLNAKNGKNNLLTIFNATNNSTLQCIQVDNAVAANSSQAPYANWYKDVIASYSEDCDGNTIETQQINLNEGWNIMSLSVVPEDANLMNVFQPVIDEGSLKKVMDESGQVIEDWGVYGGWQNDIGDMQTTEGYKINVAAQVIFEVEGVPVQFPFDIILNTGWNIISWPSPNEQDGLDVFETLMNEAKLVKVMDEAGQVIEDWGVYGGWQNDIGNLKPGEGYKVNVTEDCILTIYESGNKSEIIISELVPSTHFIPAFKGNGTDHMNINLINIDNSGIIEGDDIGIFDGDICVGSVRISSSTSSIGIPVSAKDGIECNNGFSNGNPISAKLFRNGKEHPLSIESLTNQRTIFAKGNSLFAKVDFITGLDGTLNGRVGDVQVYPNPFSEEVYIEINLLNNAEVGIEILNQIGQRVIHLVNNKKFLSGNSRVSWDGKSADGKIVSQGIYYIRVNINGLLFNKKIVLK